MSTPVFADGIDGLLTQDQMLSMSGLAFMERIRDGHSPHPPICRGMNYHLDTVEDGRVLFRGTPIFDHMNPIRSVHGGWYGTLLDSCMACAVMTKLPQGSAYTTLEYKINITRGIPVGRDVIAEGVVSHAGRSTGVAEGRLYDAETGKLYATGSTTCLIMKPG